jgi:ribosome maturation factor RimP
MPSAQAGPPLGEARHELAELLAPVVASSGYDFEDVSVVQAGRRRLVRVIVDADGGVDLDGVARVSRAVSGVLDDQGAFDGPYVLEVSSPGVDRLLREPRHWRRAAGRLVKADVEGQSVVGRVLGADADGVRLDIGGTHRHVPWAALGPGRVQIEFNRPDVAADPEKG